MEWNSRCSSFLRMRNPTPLFSLGLWRNKTIMATPEQKEFCVFCVELDYRLDVCCVMKGAYIEHL